MVVSWPEQSWAFPKRLGLFQWGIINIYYHFQKLIESPTTVRQRKKVTYQAPGATLRGRAALQIPFSSRDLVPGTTSRGRAALQVPLSSHDLVTDWVHPGGSQQSVIHRFLLLNMMPFPGLYSHGVGLLGFQFGNLCWLSNLNSIVNTVHTWSPHIYESYYKFSLQLEWSLSLPLCQHQVLLSVQSLSRVWLFVTPGTEAHQASLSITNPWSLLKLTSIEPVMPSNHLICCPLLLLPSIFPSIFSVSQLLTSAGQSIGISASALVLPMNIQDWFPLGLTSWISLQSKGLSSLLQHHSSKASVLLCSAFLIVQPSHPCMTTGKSIALTKWTFVGKCLCFLIR